MKTNRLSHSAITLYKECGQKYKYQYIERLRTTEIFSPLIWGSAIDKGIESLLKNEDYKKKFLDTWTEQEILGQPTNLKDNTLINYLSSDHDLSLLNQDDYKYLKAATGLIAEEIQSSLEDKRVLNLVNWHCLKNKGLMILECVKNEIVPQITEIISIQEKIELENDQGDKVIGYADLVAKIKGHDEPIVLDFKTTSKRYKNDSVENSEQLALYVYSLFEKYKTRKAGFIVLNKKLKMETTEKICLKCGNNGTGRRYETCDKIIDKHRCNGQWAVKEELKVDTQFLINEVPIKTEQMVLNGFEHINNLIKEEVFQKNTEACQKHYGKLVVKCPYFDKCHNGSDKGLVKIDTK